MSRERRGWVIPLLVASLALNLFLVGMLSGHVFASFDPSREMAARATSFVARFRAMPADERARFDAVYAPHRQVVIEARQNLRAARLTAFGALGAPVYDPAVMRQKLDAVRDATIAAQSAVTSALVDAFATLSPSARGVLAGAERPEGP